MGGSGICFTTDNHWLPLCMPLGGMKFIDAVATNLGGCAK